MTHEGTDTMSMDIAACFKQAASEKLGPLAAALIENGDFKEEGSFDIYFALLSEELVEVMNRINTLLVNNGQAELTTTTLATSERARAFVNLIKVFAYDDKGLTAKVATSPAPPINPSPGTPSVPNPSGQLVAPTSTTLVTPTGVIVPKPDPDGTNSCFVRGCGQKFTTFHEAMAHKCLVHGYNSGRWTQGWATDFMKGGGVVGVPLGTPSIQFPPHLSTPDPNLVTQTNLWEPTLVLDLNDLGLAPGEASRFAAGEKDTARFYFVRKLNRQTTIKGKFVWTRFAHRFNSEYVYPGDFVVRKMAGDTKEWIGLQKVQGVFNPAYNWQTKATEPKMRFEGRYVGDHEADIAEIIANPNKARTNYGKWRQECGYCGRNLTDAESRFRGIGPDCWEQKYLPSLRRAAQQP